jgi:hypothetical protein
MENELTDQEKLIIRAALIGLPVAILSSEATPEEIKELNVTFERLASIKIKLNL